jgi:hypothetical protein
VCVVCVCCVRARVFLSVVCACVFVCGVYLVCACECVLCVLSVLNM